MKKKENESVKTEIQSCLASNLKKARKAKGFSQQNLAERVGAHLTHVNRVETGKCSPSIEFVAKVAHALGVSIDALLSDSGEGIEDVHIEDKDLAERLRLLETLERHERDALITVMDGLSTKHRMRKFLAESPTTGK